MWINARRIESQQYIVPKSIINPEGLIKGGFLGNLEGWAKFGSEVQADINFWYDSEMNTQIQVENTRELVAQISEPHVRIQLRDIREIPLVESNSDIFSDNVHIYTRVDVLKHIIGDHVLSTHEADNFVMSDLKVIPMSLQEIFSKNGKHRKDIDIFGLVMARAVKQLEDFYIGGTGENFFLAMNNISGHIVGLIRQKVINEVFEEVRKDLLSSGPHDADYPAQMIGKFSDSVFRLLTTKLATGIYSTLAKNAGLSEWGLPELIQVVHAGTSPEGYGALPTRFYSEPSTE
jgi:hypothetical protein